MLSPGKPPVLPSRLTTGNRNVRKILEDLEKIRKLTKTAALSKLATKCEDLIYFVVNTVRNSDKDHLLETTVIWVLINLLRFEPVSTKRIMMSAGVPGILHNILASPLLTGATRSYASELCYFLCSDDAYPDPGKIPAIGPIPNLSDMIENDATSVNSSDSSSYVFKDDMSQSMLSELSSFLDERVGVAPFIPYRINDQNMRRIDAIFGNINPDAETLHIPSISNSMSIDTMSLSDSSWDSETAVSVDMKRHSRLATTASLSSLGSGSTKEPKASFDMLYPSANTGKYSEKLLDISNASFLARAKTSHSFKRSQKQQRGNMSSSLASIDIRSRQQLDQGSLSSFSEKSSSDGQRSARVGPAQRLPALRLHSAPNPMVPDGLFVQSTASSLSSGVSLANSKEPPDIPDYLAKLDPLSLNVNIGLQHILDDFRTGAGGGELYDSEGEDSEEEEGEEDDEDDSDDDLPGPDRQLESIGDLCDKGREIFKVKKLIAKDASGTKRSSKKKFNIFAENLVSMKFIKRLFSEKATIGDSQNLIVRMQDLFDLVDTDGSGYIPWESFSRIILSVSPPWLLRADVTAFLDAQTTNRSCTVNYQEFVMSGKVLLIEKAHPVRAKLSVGGWFRKQRMYTGDVNSYTWKNHVKWFKQNQCSTVLWLMRKASKAFTMIDILTKTADQLAFIGRKAIAVDYLLRYASHILENNEKREEAKTRLTGLSLKARRTKLLRAEAVCFLQNSGRISNKEEDVTVVPTSKRATNMLPIKPAQEIEAVTIVKYAPKKKAEYATLFRLNYQKKVAIGFLTTRAAAAKIHNARQIVDGNLLYSYARQVVNHFVRRDKTYLDLVRGSEHARDQCTLQDTIWVQLIRIGGHALKYLIRQETALEWLSKRGKRGIEHIDKRDSTVVDICRIGQKNLFIMNSKETGYAFLAQRTQLAVSLFARQKDAQRFLKRLAPGAATQSVKRAEASIWLLNKAKKSLDHTSKQVDAYVRLKSLSSRRKMLLRRMRATANCLHELGRLSKYALFCREWKLAQGNKQKLVNEIERLQRKDVNAAEKMTELSMEHKIMVEMYGAFMVLAEIVSLGKSPAQQKKSGDDLLRMALGDDDDDDDDDDDESEEEDDGLTEEEREERREALEKQGMLFSMEGSSRKTKYRKPVEIPEEPPDELIGRFGFRRLLLNGDLLKRDVMDFKILDAIFDDIDIDGTEGISFYDFWMWFCRELHSYNIRNPKKPWLEQPKNVPFSMYTLVTMEERAMLRFTRVPSRKSEQN